MPRARQSGYVLIAVLFLITLMIIALAAAAPAIGTRIKREREEELLHRARQYTRAIQLYYRRFGNFPTSLDQLQNTNNLRFLRKKYSDPMTGKDDWKLIRLGQQRPRSLPAYLSGTGSGQGGFGTPAGQQPSGQGQPGQAGQPQAGTSAPGITNAQSMSSPLSGGSTLGGGPLIGVASTSTKESLKEIDGRSKYSEWEFLYDPTLDPIARARQNQGGNPNQPGGNPGQPQLPPPGQRPPGPSAQPR